MEGMTPQANEVGIHSGPVDVFAGGGEMGGRMGGFDWSCNPLGPVSGWPQGLRTAVRIMLKSRYPMFIWWGEGLINLYNDAYITVLGQRHPWALGQPARDVWHEIWPTVGPQADGVVNEGRSTWNDDLFMTFERNGYPEEVYVTFSYSPIPDGGAAPPPASGRPVLCLHRKHPAGTGAAASEGAAGAGGPHRRGKDGGRRLPGGRRGAGGKPLRPAVRPRLPARLRRPDRPARGSHRRRGRLPRPPRACGPGCGGRAVAVRGGDGGRPNRSRRGPGIASSARCPAASGRSRSRVPWCCRSASGGGPPRRVPGGRRQPAPRARRGLPRLLRPGRGPRRHRGRQRAGATRRSAAAPRRWPSSTAPRPRSSATSATSFAPRSRCCSGRSRRLLAGREGPAGRRPRTARGRAPQRACGCSSSSTRCWTSRASRPAASQAVREPTDLAALTADLASVFRSAVERAGHAADRRLPPAPQPVCVDRDMWEKIVLNLALQRLQVHPRGRDRGRAAAERRPAAELPVRDTGVGIPAGGTAARCSSASTGCRASRARAHEGTGIGLALVQELVSCTAARSRWRAPRPRQPRSRSGSRRARPGAERRGRGAAPHPPAQPPSEDDRPRTAPKEPPSGCRTGRRAEAGPAGAGGPGRGGGRPRDGRPAGGDGARARVLVADDNGDMRQYLRRLLTRLTKWKRSPTGRPRWRPPANDRRTWCWPT